MRTAIRWGIDYDGLAGNTPFERLVVHQTFLPDGIAGASTARPFRFDVSKAKQLLNSKTPVKIVIDHAGGEYRSQLPIAIARSLESVGFEVSLRSQSARELITRMREKDFQVAMAAWGSDTADPHSNAQNFCWNDDDTIQTAAWMCRWKDIKMNGLVEDAAEMQESEARAAKYRDLQDLALYRAPFVFLAQEYFVAAIRNPGALALGYLSTQTRYAEAEIAPPLGCRRHRG